MASQTAADPRFLEELRRAGIKSVDDLVGRTDARLVSALRVDPAPYLHCDDYRAIQSVIRQRIVDLYVERKKFKASESDWETVKHLCAIKHWFGPKNVRLMLEKSLDGRLLKVFLCDLKSFRGDEELRKIVKKHLPEIKEMARLEMIHRFTIQTDQTFGSRARLIQGDLPDEIDKSGFFGGDDNTEHDLDN